MPEPIVAPRLARLPRIELLGRVVPVATGAGARLLGLAHLDRERAGTGLFFPRCASVHTFGMRFDLDVVFFDCRGRTIAIRAGVRPRRVASCRGAAAVLEIPSAPGLASSQVAPSRI